MFEKKVKFKDFIRSLNGIWNTMKNHIRLTTKIVDKHNDLYDEVQKLKKEVKKLKKGSFSEVKK